MFALFGVVGVAFLLSLVTLANSYRVFNVKDFGAKGDNKTDDTNAIRKTFQACFDEGSCTVYFPGGTYRSGALDLVSNCVVLFAEQSEISFFNDWETWPIVGKVYRSLINGTNLRNVTLRGNGIINGNGAVWWNAWLAGKLKAGRPHLLYVGYSTDVLLDGITLTYSPSFHFVPQHVVNVEVSRVTIYAPFFHKSRNTDGIDPSHCTNVHIHDCEIHTGDDNVAVKPETTNVLVENCHFGTGHGASVGSLRRTESVSNITFRNITFDGTSNGARIKVWEDWTGSATDIIWEDFRMKDVQNPIVVTMFYSDGSDLQESSPFEVVLDMDQNDGLSGLTFAKIFARDAENAGTFDCRANSPCRDITLSEVAIFASKKHEFECQNAYGTARLVYPKSCLKEEE